MARLVVGWNRIDLCLFGDIFPDYCSRVSEMILPLSIESISIGVLPSSYLVSSLLDMVIILLCKLFEKEAIIQHSHANM